MEKILFEGFSMEALEFLGQVRFNNSKEWYQEHKGEYETLLLEPFKNLVSDLSDVMLKIDPLFEVTPAINKTISRIYRDTRFSKDKSLYRDSMWFTFKRNIENWREAPGFFFEIYPGSYRYGMGYYSSTRESMDIFRSMIDDKPEQFNDIVKAFMKQDIFVIEGDEYKKKLDPGKSEEVNAWYNRKNLYLVHNDRNTARLFGRGLVDELAHGFNVLKDIYNYLCKVEEKKSAKNY